MKGKSVIISFNPSLFIGFSYAYAIYIFGLVEKVIGWLIELKWLQ